MKYNGATKVTMNQNAGHADLIVANKNHKEPTTLDLIYFDESPDYCVRDLSLGKYFTHKHTHTRARTHAL